MKKTECVKIEYLWIAFGVGSALSLFLPTVWITRILALVVIILGVMLCIKK